MNIHAYPSDITSCPNSIFLPVSRNTSCPEARQFEQGTSRFLFHLSSTDANDALLIRPLYLHIFSRALTSFSALPPPFLPRALSSTQNLSRKPLPTPSSLLHAHPWLHFEARETDGKFLNIGWELRPRTKVPGQPRRRIRRDSATSLDARPTPPLSRG